VSLAVRGRIAAAGIEVGVAGAIDFATAAGVEVVMDKVPEVAVEGIGIAADDGESSQDSVTVPFRELASRIEGKKIRTYPVIAAVRGRECPLPTRK